MGRKVLFTASTYSHIVTFHLPYLQKFQKEGWTVHVACGSTPMPIPYADEVLDLPFKKSMWSPKNFKAMVILCEKMRKENYDLVCTHTSLAAFFTRLALWGLEEWPLLANMVHGYLFDDGTPYLKRKLLLAAEQLTAPMTDLLLTMNRWDYETAVEHRLGKKIVHIPGVGVNFTRFDNTPWDIRQTMRQRVGIPEDYFVLTYVAEFSARKSHSILIQAMTQLPEYVMLALIGDGGLRLECQKLAGSLGLGDRVLFPGYLSDVPTWYAMADAAVSSSRSEGLPFNIMEAMYAGLPVIASDVKGHSDLISDGETGLLYPYGDERSFAEQVWKLLKSRELRRDLAECARKDVERYGIESVLPVVWRQYAELAPEHVHASEH